MKLRTLWIGLVSAGMALSTAVAQPPEKDRWMAYETEHFQFFSNAPQGRTRSLVESFGRLHSFVTKDGRVGLAAKPVRVFVFKSQRSMKPYLREPPQTNSVVMAWEAFNTEDRLWLSLNANIGDDVRVLAYEAYVRNYVSAKMHYLPYWARAGISSFYAGFRDKKGAVAAVGLPRAKYVVTMRQNSWLPWGQFFQVGQDSAVLDQGRTLGLFKAQAWLAAHFLMTGGPVPESAAQVFNKMKQGQSAELAIREVYGWNLDQFNNELRNYISGPSMPYFPLEVGELSVGDITERSLSRSEVLYGLAEYLVVTHRPPSLALVENHLTPLLDDSQYAGRATALLAELRVKGGDREGAEKLFRQAIEAPGVTGEDWLRYASFLADGGASDQEVRAAALQALEKGARPEAAYQRIVRSLPQIPSTDDDLAVMAEAVRVLGGEHVYLAHNLAVGHMRRDEYSIAAEVVEKYVRPFDPEDADELTNNLLENQVIARVNTAMEADDYVAAVQAYDDGLAQITDLSVVERFERSRDQLQTQITDRRQWDAMNRAVDLANARQVSDARQILRDELAAGVVDERLRSEMEKLLKQLGG